MKPHTLPRSLLAGALIATLGGCLETGSNAEHSASFATAGDQAGDDDDRAPRSASAAVDFDPENQVIPFPNNLLFEAAEHPERDGTLNAPIDPDDPDSAALIEGLNALNGFSTIASWRLEFTGEINPDSLAAGDTVRVFKLETAGNTYPERIQGTAVERELVAGEDFEVQYKTGIAEDGSSSYLLKIVPTRPLEHDTTYAAVVTDGVRDTDGNRVGSPIEWTVANGTGLLDQCDEEHLPDEPFLQCFTNNAVKPVVADPENGLERADLIMGWGVTTQREDKTFAATADFLKDDVLPGIEGSLMEFLDAESVPLDSAPLTPGGKAKIWPGTVRLPYGLDAVGLDSEGEPTESLLAGEVQTVSQEHPFLNTQWDCTSESCNSDEALGLLEEGKDPEVPETKNIQQIPAVMATPTEGEGPFPLVIFQHAIQQDRSTALAIADELADQGYAVMAIDMPLHGLVLHQLDIENDTDAQRVDLHATRVNHAMDAVEDGIDGEITSDDRLARHYERTFYTNALNRAAYEDTVATEGWFKFDEDSGEYTSANEDDEGAIFFNPETDPSGQHFLVPDTPLLQRDIMRQAALDLAMITHYVRAELAEQICVEAELIDGIDDPISWLIGETTDAGCEEDSFYDVIDKDEIHFLGHSVGNIVAAPFLAYDQKIRSAAFMAPAGGIMRTLEGSETVGPILREGLADAGLQPGEEDYYRFFNVVSAAIDPVEPLNHAAGMTTRHGTGGETEDRPIYMAQILGNDGTAGTPSDADLVLPPTVEGWPTAGSTPLANAMGLTPEPVGVGNDGSTAITADPLQIRVGFRYGDHASFLLPLDQADEPVGNVAGFPYNDPEEYNPELDPFEEMQQQVGSFFRTKGETLDFNDLDMVESQ